MEAGRARAQQTTAPWAVTRDSGVPLTLPRAVWRSVAERLEYTDSDRPMGAAADMDGDGALDWLIRSAESLCGNGGCVYVLVDGASIRPLGEFVGNVICLFPGHTRGFPAIAVLRHLSADAAEFARYRFDGASFRPVSSRVTTGAALDSLSEALGRIPRWSPPRP